MFRRLLEGPGGYLGKDFVQPLSVHGGWISPQEYGYWCLMTTDLFAEQAPEQAKEAIEVIGNITRKQLENKSSAAICSCWARPMTCSAPRLATFISL